MGAVFSGNYPGGVGRYERGANDRGDWGLTGTFSGGYGTGGVPERGANDKGQWQDKPSGGGGGGGGSYLAKAVHFDSGAYLSTSALSGIGGVTTFSTVGWVKYSVLTDTVFFWVVDPENNYLSYTIIEKAGNPAEHFDAVFSNSDFSSNYELVGANGDLSSTVPPIGFWYCFISSANVNFSTGNKLGRVYASDTDVSGPVNDAQAAFSIALSGLPFFVGNDTFSPTASFDMADLRIMPGVSLLDGGGDIPLATRRLFIDATGKPVDPAVATAALGAPCILFSGDHTTFPVNQGTGGAFTLTGALTDASTSPSD